MYLLLINQVYKVEWNTFLPSVINSCAAEWSVKIWDLNNSSPSTPSVSSRGPGTWPGPHTPGINITKNKDPFSLL